VTLNWWDDSFNKWKRIYNVKNEQEYKGNIYHSLYGERDEYSLLSDAFNYNVGLLWHTNNDKLKIGMVFKSQFTADLKHEFTRYEKFIDNTEETKKDITFEELDMPMSYGIGLAYRFTDDFTMSADIYGTQWNDHILRELDGNEKSPITGLCTNDCKVDPTHQARIGAEYVISYQKLKCRIPLRAGLFYDQSPAKGNPDDFYGVSLGAGFTQIGNTERERGYYGFSFDLALQYRYGNDVSAGIIPSSYEFSQDVREYTVYSSLIFYF